MPFERPVWPEGARCAVTLTFDNFGESYDLLRYGHAGGANADGVYAPRRGVERVLDLLAKYSTPGTFFLEGWNVRKYAPLAREIVAQGHEIGAHGWMHEQWSVLDEMTERRLIQRTTETLTDVLGHAPAGWRSPAGLTTTNTLSILREFGYEHDSSFGDDDVPYLIHTSHNSEQEIVELPWTWALDDAAFYAYPGAIRRPDDVAQLWIDEFDAAYEMTGNFMLVCHPRYTGRPARIRALERLIQHVKSRDGVWFTRCDNLARHTLNWETAPRHEFPDELPHPDQ